MSVNSGRVLSASEREVARYNMITVSEAARRLAVDTINAETVRSWIEAGWIPKCDTRKAGGKRPRYMLKWEWITEFIEQGGAPKP